MKRFDSKSGHAPATTIRHSKVPLWVPLGVILATFFPAEAEIRPGRSSIEHIPALRVPDIPLPDPVEVGEVSLDGILAFADRNAPELHLARARLDLGAAAVADAAPLLPENPQLSIGAGPRRGREGTYTDFGVSLAQRFEIAGERGLRLEAARRTKERLEAELAEARWGVHRDVHAAFHRALVARERGAAAERLLGFQEQLLDVTRRRLRAGDTSALAVRVAEGELSQARVAQVGARQDYLGARLELGAFAGWPASHPPAPAGTLDQAHDPPSHQTLVEAARRHQPRSKTLQAASTEADARARAADREAWPEPTLGIELSREGAPSGLEEKTAHLTLSLPIPLGRRNQGPRAAARAEARIAQAEERAFGSRLDSRIARHRSAVAAAAARLRAFGTEILPTFEENLRLIQRALELGEIDILQVSVARERFLHIQNDALDAYSDYFRAVADLEASIGTDLWPDDHHEVSAPREDRP